MVTPLAAVAAAGIGVTGAVVVLQPGSRGRWRVWWCSAARRSSHDDAAVGLLTVDAASAI
jgi:hypothetical protein